MRIKVTIVKDFNIDLMHLFVYANKPNFNAHINYQ
jgi:hypothetical protein